MISPADHRTIIQWHLGRRIHEENSSPSGTRLRLDNPRPFFPSSSMTEILILSRHHVRFWAEVEELCVLRLSHSFNIPGE